MLTDALMELLAASIHEARRQLAPNAGIAGSIYPDVAFALLERTDREHNLAAARRMVAAMQTCGFRIFPADSASTEALDPAEARSLLDASAERLAEAEHNEILKSREGQRPEADPYAAELPDLRTYRELKPTEIELLRRRVASYFGIIVSANMVIGLRPEAEPGPPILSMLGGMNMVVAIIKPFKLEDVKEAISEVGVEGMTVNEVKGFGRQKGHTDIYRGSEYTVDFLAKVMVIIVVEEGRTNQVVDAISKSAGTQKIGDGKIFILPVSDAVRIRTGERGVDAVN